MKVLITGGCGFIGTNIISKLLRDSQYNKIYILDNFSNSNIKNFKKNLCFLIGEKNLITQKVKIFKGDIKNLKSLKSITGDIDIIIHLAASAGVDISIKDPTSDFMNNTLGTFNVLEFCRLKKIKKIILASSGAAIGEARPPINENILPRPITPYGASKLSNEAYALAFGKSYGMQSIILRFSNVYGPACNLKNSVVSKFIKDFILKGTNQIYGDGSQTRDFIYVDDLVKAVLKIIKNKNISNEIFQISTGKETKISYINKVVSKNLFDYGYANLKTKYLDKRKGDVKKNYSDNSKAYKKLNWNPTTDINIGIAKLLNI